VRTSQALNELFQEEKDHLYKKQNTIPSSKEEIDTACQQLSGQWEEIGNKYSESITGMRSIYLD
jgi:hypothetical protein